MEYTPGEGDELGQLLVATNAADTNELPAMSEDTAEDPRVAVDHGVSVAIRSVRVNPLLVQTLECLERQSLQPDEVVIAIPADLTLDEQAAWKQVVAQSALPIRLVEGPHSMIGQREAGLRAACTELVFLLDDDIVFADSMLETLVRTARDTGAQCVVPYAPGGFPQTRLRKVGAAFFLMEVPYAGSGGVKYLPNGGFRYPTAHLAPGEVVETDAGIGWAILVNRDWVLRHDTAADYRLQGLTYSLRGDAAFTHGQKLAGGKVLMVNAGDIRHLEGTTMRDPRRLRWENEAALYNTCVFWYCYIFPYQRGRFMRMVSVLSLAWLLIGVHAIALKLSIQRKTLLPLHGLAQGYRNLISMGASGHTESV